MALKKTGILWALLACLLLAVSPARAGSPQVWRTGTLAPRGLGWARQVNEILIPSIRRATEGNLAFRMYWGGVKGDEEDYLRQMRAGQLEAAGITAQGAILISPQWAVVELPFLFHNYGEVDFIKQKMFPAFEKLMDEKGFKLHLWIDQDFDQVYCTEKPLNNLASFKGLYAVSWYGPLEEKVFERLGAKAIPTEVPALGAALKSGQAQAIIGPTVWMVGTQLAPVLKYATRINIRYAPALIVVTHRAWYALPRNYRKNLIADRWEMTRLFCADTREDNEKSFQAMKDYGIREVKVSPRDLKEIQKALAPVATDMAGRLYPQSMLDELTGWLEQYRKNQ